MMIATIIFRPLIIIALLVISIVFIVQNQQPVLPLVIFGTKTIQLSLAIWVMIFTGAGIFTSLLLLLLYRSFGKTTTPDSRGSIPSPPPVSPPRTAVREVFRQKPAENLSDSRRFSEPISSPVDSRTNPQWDGENTDKDWDLETPPSQPTVIQQEREEVGRSFSQPQSERQSPQQTEPPQSFTSTSSIPQSSNFEVQQQPKAASRQGTVYSYSYKEAKQSPSRPPSQVYDADYRVINPPYRENAPQQTDEDNEDEDWI